MTPLHRTEEKDSGLPLVGRIPPDWKVVPAYAFTRYRRESITTDMLDGREVVHYSIPALRDDGEPVEEDGVEIGSTKLAVKGDEVLVSRLNPHKGHVALTDHHPEKTAVCSSEFVPLVPTAADRRFVYYLYLSRATRERIFARVRSATRSHARARPEDVYKLRHAVPPFPVQREIADFLDERTVGIDQIVDDKKRLIRCLEEKRQALIRHAVSGGLDERRPTKEARLPWLESIPEGWDEVQIRFVARLESGHTPSRSKPEYWATEKLTVPWVTLADVWQMREARREYIEDTEEMISEDGVANSGARVLPKGTVMLSRTASVGFSGIMARPMATSQDFANWVCGPDLLPEFLLFVFRSMKSEFERLMIGSTHQTIYMPEIRRLMTPLPPREEQEAIVRSLRARLDPLDSVVRDIRTQLDALREYRTSLITDAVTGQVDVRASASAVV